MPGHTHNCEKNLHGYQTKPDTRQDQKTNGQKDRKPINWTESNGVKEEASKKATPSVHQQGKVPGPSFDHLFWVHAKCHITNKNFNCPKFAKPTLHKGCWLAVRRLLFKISIGFFFWKSAAISNAVPFFVKKCYVAETVYCFFVKKRAILTRLRKTLQTLQQYLIITQKWVLFGKSDPAYDKRYM